MQFAPLLIRGFEAAESKIALCGLGGSKTDRLSHSYVRSCARSISPRLNVQRPRARRNSISPSES
jgi:hypothetical protein